METVSKLPSTPKKGNCDQHGSYEFRYMPTFGGRHLVSDQCPACAEELSKSESVNIRSIEQQEKYEKAKHDRISAGISPRNVDVTFDDFIADTPEKQHIVNVMMNLGRKAFRGEQVGSVILSGNFGTGKTMICSAVINRMAGRRRAEMIKLIDLIRKLKETFSRDCRATERGIIDYYVGLDLLIIDEIGMQFGTDTEKMFLFDIIDGRYQNMKPTVIVSNLDFEGINEIMGERSLDRLRDSGGKLLTFDWESARK